MRKIQHAPCAVTKFDVDGNIIDAYVETRAPMRAKSDYESDSVAYKFRVMATQETGELQFIAYCKNYEQGDEMVRRHLATHQDHRNAFVERL